MNLADKDQFSLQHGTRRSQPIDEPVIHIRRANQHDLPSLARMASELARQHERYDNRRFSLRPMEEAFTDFYRNELHDENSALIVGEIEGQLAGYVFVRIEPDSIVEWFKATGWVHDLFVVKRWRKSHVGSQLLQAGIDHLRQIGSPGVMLAVAAKNGTARRFFKRHGFRVTMHEMRLDFEPADPPPAETADPQGGG